MPQCTYKPRKYNKYCLGDFIHRITLHERKIKAPLKADVNYDINLTKKITVWARIDTVAGKVIFDSVNMDRTVTHVILVRYISYLTTEHWVEHQDKYFDIVKIVNIGDENRFLELYCNERGDKNKKANLA